MASTCLARRKLDVWCLFARSNYRSKTTKEGVQLILIKSASEERFGMFMQQVEDGAMEVCPSKASDLIR